MSQRAGIWLSFWSLVLIWGSTFLLVKIAVAEAHPAFVGAMRVILAALAVVPAALVFRRAWPRGAVQWLTAAAVAALSLTIPYTLLAFGQVRVPSGIVGVYMATIPLIILPLAHLLIPGERITARKALGFVIGFLGVLTLIGPQTLLQLGSADAGAQLMCLGAALCYASGSITIRLAPKMDPVGLSAAALLLAAVATVPVGLAFRPAEPIGAPAWGAIAVVGFLSSGLAMILRVYVISTAGPVFLSVVGYILPVYALMLGAVFANEVITPRAMLAFALIALGVGIIQNLPRLLRQMLGRVARREGA